MRIQIADYSDYIIYLKATNKRAYGLERARATQQLFKISEAEEMEKRLKKIANRSSKGNSGLSQGFSNEANHHNQMQGMKAMRG